ncbi:glycosyltransferase family 4 protein [Candidatus Roizmanbacteria bacterium]|nr:glycosyltransferase family 4 protein [Candidatus Roizmanbacteria bacterium]
MKIGIDISQIVYEGTGVGRFVNGLTEAVLHYDSGNEWTFFFSSLRQNLSPQLKNNIKKSCHHLLEYKLPPTALSFLWNSIHRMKVEKLVGVQDWFITSDWTEPPSHMKKATIVHDLAYLKYPETVYAKILQTQKQRMHWVKKESSIIFADSETTKHDAVNFCGLDEKKLFVNYPGVQFPSSSAEEVTRAHTRFGLGKPFILTVGKIEPRKNLKRLIDAFTQIDNGNVELIIVGHQGWDTETSKKQSQSKNIKFLSYITDLELSALYSSCLFFIYPSLYEGFGYPLVEAMKCGAAVATSDGSSMREIGRNCTLLFDPKNTNEISSVLKKLIEDGDLRNKLKKQGIMRGRDFAWKNYYDRMMEVLIKH